MRTILCILLVSSLALAQDSRKTADTSMVIPFKEESGERRILVDNLAGSILVTGYDGEDVRMTARRTIWADSDRRFEEAAEDVTLDIVAERDRIEIVVDSPWRDRWGSWNERGYDYYRYRVTYDFELQVPRDVAVYLRTCDEGDINVRDVSGHFEVKNVNGDVTMSDMGGYGRASTVNGSLDLTFTTVPRENCSFQTVNGEVDVAFPGSLSAVLVLKTFNGRAYTDFELQPTEPPELEMISKQGTMLYKLGNHYAVQVGDGGPRIAFDTLNGDITIRKRTGT